MLVANISRKPRLRRTAGLSFILFALLFQSACVVAGGAVPRAGASPGAPSEGAADGGHLYHADGHPADLGALVEQALGVDVVFMGERHGDPAAHALQLQLLDALIDGARDSGRDVVLSMEMFERDVQDVLDEYLAALITEEHFLAAARPWPRYARDYRPLVERAREGGLRVVAANAPRRYVNRVSRLGIDALEDLPDEAMTHLPSLPFPGPSAAYRAEWDALMAQMSHGASSDGNDRALQAQALWDAAMAEAIHRALTERPGRERDGVTGPTPPPLVLHVVGSFHVENRTGIPELLRHYAPGVRDLVITTRSVENPADFATAMAGTPSQALADFILLTPRAPGAPPR